MEVMTSQKLHISSKTENITLVENLIESVCEVYHIHEDYYGNILIAVTEAVNNAIQHGNKFNPNKSIDVQFIPKSDKILFTIIDEGDGFDYLNIPDPTNPENISKPHGRGIYLIQHLADKVEFFDRGRRVEISFNICAN